MSRIAKLPISIPNGVKVEVSAASFSASGPKGQMSLPLPEGIKIEQKEDAVSVVVDDQAKSGRADQKLIAMSGTARALIFNLIYGVSEGFEKHLSIVGVGYRAQMKGKLLNLSLGFSHPVAYPLPDGVTVETPEQTTIVVRGMDKQLVGQVAADIRAYRPPEPYKGKGIRYKDEYVRRKQAKKK